MKAMVLRGQAPISTTPLHLTDLPTPKPGPGEVQIRVHCCAICRTDLHVIEGDLPPEKLPLVPGHQIIGTVSTLGSDCTKFGLGQRVGVAWLRHTCGACELCESGRENLCERQRFTGYHADGGYAEYAVVPEDYAYEIPPTLSDQHAVPLLCAGIIGFRALKRSQLPQKGKLALFGFGSSAHVVIQIARHWGCDVSVVTRGKAHRELARELGTEWVGESVDQFPTLVDSAIIFAPAGDLVPKALSVLKRGGTLALAGIYMSDIPSLDYEKHLFYERNIHSVTANTREDGRELLNEAAKVPVSPKITRYALTDANIALTDLKADRLKGTGVLMMKKEGGR